MIFDVKSPDHPEKLRFLFDQCVGLNSEEFNVLTQNNNKLNHHSELIKNDINISKTINLEMTSKMKNEKFNLVKQNIEFFKLSNENQQALKLNPSFKNWVIYVNGKLSSEPQKVIRPRSHVSFILKTSVKPSLNIIFKDQHLVILDKPTGLPTQKTLKKFEENLYDQVRLFFAIENNFRITEPYVGLHHRLDRDTSGLVLMTLKKEANKEISNLFSQKKITKEYLAYVEYGSQKPPQRWKEKNKIIRAHHPSHPFYFKVDNESGEGQEAITHFTCEESQKEKGYHKILCFPLTGRTHQLRVQLSHRGWPILGDNVYGHNESAPRLMLHAQRLLFEFKGKNYDLYCPPSWSAPT